MDVVLSDEQLLWQQAVTDLAAAHAVTNPSDIPTDVDAGWGEVVGIGLPALRSPELCGVDATAVESVLAVEAAARHLTALPVLGQGVLGPELLAAAGATDLLAEVADGALRVAPALDPTLLGLGQRGAPVIAFDTVGADRALVLDGARLCTIELTEPATNGLDLTRRVTRLDDTRSATPVGDDIAPERLAQATAVGLTALAADLLGVMDGALWDVAQYTKDREQFGVPIGSFQALQHLLADALVSVEGTRSCLWHAAWACDHLDEVDALLAARTAKAYCSQAGQRVVEATVQAFGGVAITWEQLSHLRLRRVHLDRQVLGDEHTHHLAIAEARLASTAG